MASPSTSVAFPSSSDLHQGPPVPPSPHRRRPLISFRRISLPPPPALLNRQSSASLTSFDSFPDGNTNELVPDHTSAVKGGGRNLLHKQSHAEAGRRHRKRRESVKPQPEVDENKAVKRRKIIAEFYDTERAYIRGLDLIYSHFLTPIIESLDTHLPLLDREDLVTVFSNFIDIWNLHRSFFTSLTDLLSSSLTQPGINPPALSPVLVSHFPYLSLYSPFITSFPEVVTKLAHLQASNPAFDAFLKDQEADERCGKLKLRDWLLTIVQRCPRYLLLLKDLINCTDSEDPEHASLVAAHALLSKVTTSLDTSLHTHAQTLTLLAFQRATPNLPIQLVSPGRTFLKRGTLMQLDNASVLKEREFLLFSDCLIWLANGRAPENEWQSGSDVFGWGALGFSRSEQVAKRPEFKRRRSKSENELPDMRNQVRRQERSKSKQSLNQPNILEERWLFMGKIDLVDVEVVVTPPQERGDEARLEILSPEMSFAIYADHAADREEWASAIRSAKSSLLVSLNVMHPNSTLASSSSTDHLRRSLQASPYSPEDSDGLPKRGKVDHYVSAIWVPDGKSELCMRCGKMFGWRRRRHHCRLCGRCVCGACSEKTFFITDPSGKSAAKSARACNACYETVFPLIEASNSIGTISEAASGNTLSSFPSWSIQKPVRSNAVNPSELMAFSGQYRSSSSSAKRAEVIRRQKSRPLSYPIIPQVFSEAANKDSPLALQPYDEMESTQETTVAFEASRAREGNVLEDISSMSLNTPDITGNGSISLPNSPMKVARISSRERKRFSMPAVSLQTTAVTTRPKVTGEGPTKRFSLVLGGKSKPVLHDEHQPRSNSSKHGWDLRHGIAATRLQQLLEKTSSSET